MTNVRCKWCEAQIARFGDAARCWRHDGSTPEGGIEAGYSPTPDDGMAEAMGADPAEYFRRLMRGSF